jgi:esterase/lipase
MGKDFVLIHGAWHGGWCWEGVIKELERAGHTAEAPTMPGHQPGDDRSKVTFQDYVNRIVSVLEAKTTPVVLVGHSSAGFLLQSAAPKVCVFRGNPSIDSGLIRPPIPIQSVH